MLRLRLLGDMGLEVDRQPRPAPDRGPGRALLGWLALHPGRHTRTEVAARLWPDASPDNARASLRSALASVRRALGPDHDRYLCATRSTVGLDDGERVEVDLRTLERLAAEGKAEEALQLWTGDLLQGLDDEWVLAARDDARSRLSRTLAVAADEAEAAGDLARSIELSRRRLALDPLDEPVARALIRRLTAAGDRAGALHTFGQFAERMYDELRLLPSPETRRLVGELRRDDTRTSEPDGLLSDDRALSALPPTAGDAERAELLLALAGARRRAGAAAREVRESFLRAADLARSASRRDLLAEAAMGVASVPWFPGGEPVDEEAVQLLTDSLDAAPAAAAIRARALLAREHYFGRDPGLTAADASRTVAEARAVGDPAALAVALDAHSLALAGRAAPDERRRIADELVAVAAAMADTHMELRGRMWRVVASLEGGRLEVVDEEGPVFERRAADLDEPAWRWWPALWKAMRALADGHLGSGERLAWVAYEIGEQPFGERAVLELQTQLFYVRWRQGRLGELAATSIAMADRYRAIPAWRCVRALVDAATGRDDDARAQLRELAADGFGALPEDINRLIGLALAGEAALALEEPACAAAAHAALLPWAGRRPVSGYGGLVLEPVDRTLERLDALVIRPP